MTYRSLRFLRYENVSGIVPLKLFPESSLQEKGNISETCSPYVCFAWGWGRGESMTKLAVDPSGELRPFFLLFFFPPVERGQKWLSGTLSIRIATFWSLTFWKKHWVPLFSNNRLLRPFSYYFGPKLDGDHPLEPLKLIHQAHRSQQNTKEIKEVHALIRKALISLTAYCPVHPEFISDLFIFWGQLLKALQTSLTTLFNFKALSFK